MAGKGAKEEKVDYQKRTVELLEEIVKWTKFSSFPHVRQVLLDILPTDENKIAYHYSDGGRSEDIASFANIDSSTVRDWGKIWIKAHIAEAKSVRGGERAIKLFSLEDFGIEIPKPKSLQPIKQDSKVTPLVEKVTEEKKDE